MFPIRTILHPTDFSEHSRAATELACALARDYGARLYVLHVLPLTLAYGEGFAPPAESPLEEIKLRLDQVGAAAPGVRIERRLFEGRPATEILSLARAMPCDLIVMGTHGRTGLGRLLMGSVAEEIVRKAPCPVLTVKTPAARPEPEKEARPEEAAHAAGV